MILGFTGTQVGLTRSQLSNLGSFLRQNLSTITEAHHGLCVGGDYQFHQFCLKYGIPIIGHPPLKTSKMMSVRRGEFSQILPAKDYLARNRDIVDACGLLIAGPKTAYEELRSGTWSTVRYARKRSVRAIVLHP